MSQVPKVSIFQSPKCPKVPNVPKSQVSQGPKCPQVPSVSKSQLSQFSPVTTVTKSQPIIFANGVPKVRLRSDPLTYALIAGTVGQH